MNVKVKPRLRGHFHQAAFFMALGAGAVLLAVAPNPLARWVGLVYALSLAGMFGVSALYHRITWRPEIRVWWRRLDHSAIFILIAGTGTPVSVLGIGGEHGDIMLAIFWGAALVGVFKELVWTLAPRWISAVLYVMMGWACVLYYSEMATGLGPVGIGFMIAGGVAYTVGALIYASKKPNPFPATFGYHEIFHALTIIAGLLHFMAVFRLVAAG
jgi:hemolysin III